MKLIVGLGNPGTKYEKTRHNLGFMVVEQFLKDFEPVEKTVWENNAKFKSDIAEINWQPKRGEEEKIVLAKPKTFMNNSGMAVKVLSSWFSVFSSDLWIIHDDVDLPLGAIKIRFGGAAAGHRGVESIINTLATDKFWRFRMGIGHPRHAFTGRNLKFDVKGVDEYVLKTFSGAEKGKLKDLVKHGAKAIAFALEQSLEAAQNRFNTK